MQQKTLVQLGLVGILLVAAGAWLYLSDSAPGQNTPSGDEAVARVGSEDITRGAFETVEKQFLVGLSEEEIAGMSEGDRAEIQGQTLDRLIAQALLRQAAVRAGVSASEEEVQTEIDAIRAQFENNETYTAAVSAQGYTEESLRSQIASDIAAQAYLEQELKLSEVTATDAEIQAEYDLAAAQDEELAPLDDVRDQIAEFLIQQKQQQLVAAHIEELRTQANVEILI